LLIHASKKHTRYRSKNNVSSQMKQEARAKGATGQVTKSVTDVRLKNEGMTARRGQYSQMHSIILRRAPPHQIDRTNPIKKKKKRDNHRQVRPYSDDKKNTKRSPKVGGENNFVPLIHTANYPPNPPGKCLAPPIAPNLLISSDWGPLSEES